MNHDDVVTSVKHGADIVSAGVMLATLASWLPSIAALFTIVWTAIRIWETAMKKLLGRG